MTSYSSNGNDYVHSYLNKFFTYTGVGIIGGFDFRESEWSLKSDIVATAIRNLAKDTLIAHETKNLKITKKQETIFQQFKLKYQDSKFQDEISYSRELMAWNKSEMANCDSLKEYAQKLVKW